MGAREGGEEYYTALERVYGASAPPVLGEREGEGREV